MNSSITKAEEIIKRYEQIWMGLENVTGIGTGKTNDGRICLVISMAKDDQPTRDIFPPEIEGLPVQVRIGGKFDAL